MEIPSVLAGLLGPKTPPVGGNAAQQAAPSADFGSMLKQAIGALGGLSAQADASSLKLSTGQPVDVHQVMLDAEQASLGFQVALQVRNKLIDAYQDVMRMSV